MRDIPGSQNGSCATDYACCAMKVAVCLMVSVPIGTLEKMAAHITLVVFKDVIRVLRRRCETVNLLAKTMHISSTACFAALFRL